MVLLFGSVFSSSAFDSLPSICKGRSAMSAIIPFTTDVNCSVASTLDEKLSFNSFLHAVSVPATLVLEASP